MLLPPLLLLLPPLPLPLPLLLLLLLLLPQRGVREHGFRSPPGALIRTWCWNSTMHCPKAAVADGSSNSCRRCDRTARVLDDLDVDVAVSERTRAGGGRFSPNKRSHSSGTRRRIQRRRQCDGTLTFTDRSLD
jgi:hypothetical protein